MYSDFQLIYGKRGGGGFRDLQELQYTNIKVAADSESGREYRREAWQPTNQPTSPKQTRTRKGGREGGDLEADRPLLFLKKLWWW